MTAMGPTVLCSPAALSSSAPHAEFMGSCKVTFINESEGLNETIGVSDDQYIA